MIQVWLNMFDLTGTDEAMYYLIRLFTLKKTWKLPFKSSDSPLLLGMSRTYIVA